MSHIGTELTFRATPGVHELLHALHGSVVFTTYHSGKLGLVSGVQGGLRMFLRTFPKPMGMAIQKMEETGGWRLALAAQEHIHLLESTDQVPQDQIEDEATPVELFLAPRTQFSTPGLATHEMAFDADGRLWFCNTAGSSLATLSQTGSVETRWKPTWITDESLEDRCHLNGLAMRDGAPGWVTCFAPSNVAQGWRAQPIGQGCLIDVGSGEVVHGGLCMPHSPRVVGDAVWVLNSGYGQVLAIDPGSGRETEIVRLPGYTRGLAIVGKVALVGLSQLREQGAFAGLPIHGSLLPLKCGIVAIDIPTGKILGMLEMTSGCSELFDLQWLPDLRGVQVGQGPIAIEA